MKSKRVDIVSLKIVKESSLFYAERRITSSENAATLLRKFLEDADRECFMIICVNTKNEPTAINVVSIGSLNSTVVHPREVFKVAILANSAAVLLGHNHPSGDPTPSKEDIELTRRICEAGKIIGVEVLDHVIIGENDRFTSLKTEGLM